MRPGLQRVRALLTALGEPQRRFDSVLVGGTNGKGSTAWLLAHMLGADGRRTALFTSPHLTHFAERFVVAGAPVSPAALENALTRVRPHAEALEATFFEVVTALACELFAAAGVEVAVMEVGLGGRLDATNALEPLLSVITNVDLDHTEVLGETVAAIAREKAGILRPGHPAVTGTSAEVWPQLDAAGADLWALGREWDFERVPGETQALTLRLPGGELRLHTRLLGAHGAHNAALAAAAAARLGVGEEAIRRGAAGEGPPGRLQRWPWRGGELLLDGAHNPAGVAALLAALRELRWPPGPLLFGAMADKDLGGMVAQLAAAQREHTLGEVWVTGPQRAPRAAPPGELAERFAALGVAARVFPHPAAALAALPPGGRAVVCGSLYLLGEVLPLLQGERGEAWERWQ